MQVKGIGYLISRKLRRYSTRWTNCVSKIIGHRVLTGKLNVFIMSRILLYLLLFFTACTLQPSTFTAYAQIPLPTRFCENIDLSAFCVVDNHFSFMIEDEWPALKSKPPRFDKKYYRQFWPMVSNNIFKKGAWKESEDDVGFLHPEDRTTTQAPLKPGQTPATTVAPQPKPPRVEPPDMKIRQRDSSVFSALDMCEMERSLYAATTKRMNSYEIEINGIEVNGKPLHNHLHLKITGGTFNYAFVVVNDQDGWAVGDFNTGVPCGHWHEKDCECDEAKQCHQAQTDDTIPCMFTSDKAVTHPGQFMYYNSAGTKELHLTWRFAQSADPSLFTKELHFRTLLIETTVITNLKRDCEIKYQFSNPKEAQECMNTTANCKYSDRRGIIGWNAKYEIYHPTDKTLGAWDYFRKGFIKQSEVKCHAELPEGHYVVEPYPSYLNDNKDDLNLANYDCKKQLKITDDKGPHLITGALSSMYNWLTWSSTAQIYFGVPDIQAMPIYARPQPNVRDPKFPEDTGTQADILNSLLNLPTEASLVDEERCRCPRLGTPPPEKTRFIPKKLQLESRKDHAINMTLAWIVMVPLAIFVSRYYKETYSKVFFLQEYWWFTIHFLSLCLACVFMLGGIYGIEVKRVDKIFVDDPVLLAHVIIGGIAISLFILHLLLGAFRFRHVGARVILIFLHWFFGVLEWFLAIAAIYLVAWVPAGCMSCGFFIVACVFVVGQIIFFTIMEIHFRRVDKKLKLRPKRRYLPPPVMRVFHINAPGSKFRIYMLLGYVCFCIICYIVAHVFIAITPYYGSCFDEDIADTEDRIKIEEIDMILQEEQDIMSTTEHGHGHHAHP